LRALLSRAPSSWFRVPGPRLPSPFLVLQWSVFNAHLSCVYTNFFPQSHHHSGLPLFLVLSGACELPWLSFGSLGTKFCAEWLKVSLEDFPLCCCSCVKWIHLCPALNALLFTFLEVLSLTSSARSRYRRLLARFPFRLCQPFSWKSP